MKTLVVGHRIITYDYFLNHLEEWEIHDLLENIQFADINQWEQCRFNAFITAQINSKKKLKPSDILSFVWDQKEKQIDLNNENEVKAMKEKMKSLEKIIKSKSNGIITENIT